MISFQFAFKNASIFHLVMRSAAYLIALIVLIGCSNTAIKDGGSSQQFSDGQYVGEFKDGKFNGKGTFKWKNGDVYTGDYKNGKPNGSGVLQYANGDSYTGSFIGGDFYGTGKLVVGKDVYVGDFLANRFNGNGELRKSNGDKYVGSFSVGKFDGYGTYTWRDGTKFSGNFTDVDIRDNLDRLKARATQQAEAVAKENARKIAEEERIAREQEGIRLRKLAEVNSVAERKTWLQTSEGKQYLAKEAEKKKQEQATNTGKNLSTNLAGKLSVACSVLMIFESERLGGQSTPVGQQYLKYATAYSKLAINATTTGAVTNEEANALAKSAVALKQSGSTDKLNEFNRICVDTANELNILSIL